MMHIAKDRSRLAYKVRYAIRNPRRVLPYARRFARDAILRRKGRDHVTYYRAVMRSDAAKSPEAAVGSDSHPRWLALGRMQFDYLAGHGLRPSHRMLEIGCGNLRAGWRFINHLDTANYYGIDISPDILLAGLDTIEQYELQEKLPHLTVVENLKFGFLPRRYFDVVHAHSVFSHCPPEVIDECLAHVGDILTEDGFFDFTFNRTVQREHHVLREDYYYRTETLMRMAGKHGLTARLMDDWEQLPHKQSKLRVTR